MGERVLMDIDQQVKEVQEKYCELIFKEEWDSELDERELERVFKNINTLDHRWHIPYQLITQKIYDMNVSHDGYERLKNSIIDRFNNTDNVPQNLKEDTLRHIELAITQKDYINKNIKIASVELDEIQDTKSKIYTDFITILGIFTAITFAIFGGLQLIGNSLGNLKGSVTIKNVGGILIIAAVILLSVYLILMALIVGLSKLLSRNKNERYKFTGVITACIISSIIGLFLTGCLFCFL